MQQDRIETFRIIIVQPGTSKILVSGELSGLQLPALEIPARIRQAEAISTRLPALVGLDAYCLFLLPQGRSPSISWNYIAASASVRSPQPSADFYWLSGDSLAPEQFRDGDDWLAVHGALEQVETHRPDRDTAFFGRPGWLGEIMDWAERAIEPQGLHLSGRCRQLNASPSASLLRLATHDSAVWFKAAGDPAVRELRITRHLARHFPAFLPEWIAEHEASHGWLSREVPGVPPDNTSPDEAWIAVSAALAELQIASLGHTLHLTRAGCRDVRPVALPELIQPFFEVIAHLMESQPNSSPPRLSRAQLDEVKSILFDAIASLEALDIPATLGHLDFNTGNMLVGRDRVVFLDWASGCIGSPLLSHEYLLEQLRMLRPAEPRLLRSVRTAYTEKWQALIGKAEMSAALALTPLVAAFCYGAASDAWTEPARLGDPDTAGHLRSIARRIKKEAELWASAVRSHSSCSLIR